MNYSFLSEIKLARAPAASRIRIDEVNPVLSANSTENHFDSLFFLLRFRILTFFDGYLLSHSGIHLR